MAEVTVDIVCIAVEQYCGLKGTSHIMHIDIEATYTHA
jgi:hypothetical protein